MAFSTDPAAVEEKVEAEDEALPTAVAGAGDWGDVSHEEWRRWGTSSPLPAAVAGVIHELLKMEAAAGEKMRFGGVGSKLKGNFKDVEDKKHRAVYERLADSDQKLRYFSARQIGCRLLGCRGYLCQKCWLPTEDCMCTNIVPCNLWKGMKFWLYMHPKDFLRQNNTGKLLWQVFGIQAAQLCLFGIQEHEDIMWDAFQSSGKGKISVLYPNKSSTPKSVKDLEFDCLSLTADLHESLQDEPFNFVLLDGTWSNSAALYRRLKERWTATWGDEDIPCIALSTLSASVMHKLRPQPAWDRTCTAAAAAGLLWELNLRPELSAFELEKQAEAVECSLDILLDALTARRSLQDEPFNFVLLDGTWSNSAALYRRLKERWTATWGDEDIPCIALSTLSASVMHKLRPQPAWDRTCTAAAAAGLLWELNLRPELSAFELEKQAEAVECSLDILLDALTARRSLQDEPFNFVLLDGTWSNSAALYRRLKERWTATWGDEDIPCIALSTLSASVMHKLRPQPAWDRTCTAAAAAGLLWELNLRPELSAFELEKQAEAVECSLDILLDALTARRSLQDEPFNFVLLDGTWSNSAALYRRLKERWTATWGDEDIPCIALSTLSASVMHKLRPQPAWDRTCTAAAAAGLLWELNLRPELSAFELEKQAEAVECSLDILLDALTARRSLQDEPFNFVLLDGTWSNSAALYRRLKERWTATWGDEDIPCIALSTLSASVMHKLRPQPAWDRTCTAAAAAGLLWELNLRPELSAFELEKQAEAVECSLDILLDALTARRSLQDEPFNFVLLDGTWSNSAALYRRLKERWTATWGDEDIPCIALSTLSASVMHKLRPQPAWDRTCTAAAAAGLLWELNLRPELSAFELEKQAEAVECSLDILLDALTARRSLQDEPFNFVLLDGTWSNSAALYRRLKERWTATWGDEDIPCIALSTLSASVMHKLRPQPAWDRTCTAAAAAGLLWELNLRPELSAFELEKQAEAVECSLDILLDALTARRSLQDEPFNFVLLDGTWSNSAALYRRLKERWTATWGDEDIPCIALSTLSASVMHKLRPQPAWDRTCTAAAAAGLLWELNLRPELSAFELEKQAEAVECSLDILLDALTARRVRLGRSITRKQRHNRNCI